MPKKRITMICLFWCLLFLTACGNHGKEKTEDTKLELKEGQIKIYYTNLEKTQLVPVPYNVNKSIAIKNQAEDILEILDKVGDEK